MAEQPTKQCVTCRARYESDATVCPVDGAILVPASDALDPFVGTRLGQNYDILSIAGKGGMGLVYKARHIELDRIVAIKILRSDLVSDEKSYIRFQVEAIAASRLTHPNIVAVYDYGVAPTGQPFLIMEYVEGKSLLTTLAESGPLPVQRAMPIFIQTLNALEHAHRHEVVHRDIKPSNIILVPAEGQPDLVKIVDFGIAQLSELQGEGLRVTQPGELCGSPMYMSPEQCTGDAVDWRTDIYSVGATMYETLMGVAPLEGRNAIDTIQKKFSEDPKPFILVRPNSSISQNIEAVIFKALSREANRRFQTVPDMRNALETAAHGYSFASRELTGLPAMAIPSEFAGMDLRKEIEKASLSAHKLKSRAMAARLLGVEKESAPIHIEKLKDITPEKKPLPISAIISVSAGCLLLICFGLFLRTMPKVSTASVSGKITALAVSHKRLSKLAVQTADGKTLTFDIDDKTEVDGKPGKSLSAKVFYTGKNSKLHASKVIVVH